LNIAFNYLLHFFIFSIRIISNNLIIYFYFYSQRERPALEEAVAKAAYEREQADIAAKFAASEALRLQVHLNL
jgi:hypothetical protein